MLGRIPPLFPPPSSSPLSPSTSSNSLSRPSGYFPGHIHAFYLEYVYFERRNQSNAGTLVQKRAPGVYSENIQHGGQTTYGTVTT